MGNRFDPAVAGLMADAEHACNAVGEYYSVIGHGLLVERGDEYLGRQGRFVPFALEAVGRPVPRGLLARRPNASIR